MLAATRKKTLKKISEITFDLDIINPIESKNLFGGCDYCSNGWNASNMNHYGPENNYQGGLLDTVVVYNNNYFGNNFNDSSNHILSGGYLSDWNNYGGDNNGGAGYSGSDWQQYDNSYDNNQDSNGDGISDENEILIQNYPGENLTFNEKIWLLNNLHHLNDMIENKDLAEVAGRNQHNGVFDALRHALWSALDAFDLGGNLAESFHTLHETEHWNDIESPSDLNNNSWGYQWALINGNAQNNMNQFNIDFNAAVASGEITIIP